MPLTDVRPPWPSVSIGSTVDWRGRRDVGIAIETLAVFIRFWPATTPAANRRRKALGPKTGERYDAFVTALGRDWRRGRSCVRKSPRTSLDRMDQPREFQINQIILQSRRSKAIYSLASATTLTLNIPSLNCVAISRTSAPRGQALLEIPR